MALLKQSLTRAFSTVLVSGEVVDPLVSQRGHLYFRLTDGQAELKAVMWRREADRLRAPLQPGDQVTVRGSLDLYAPRGDLQLVATAIMQSGRGQKLLSLTELRGKLKEEGLFDRPRRSLPLFPRSIGVVTSLSGAVIHDIYQSVQKRYPGCRLVVSPASVSGSQAAPELVAALGRLRSKVDLVIVARGGGSFEELLPFSDETLVRQVAAYPIPVIAAVGHGSDQTLLDLVADHTAPTPTAAAVLATPDGQELLLQLSKLKRRALLGVKRSLSERRHRWDGLWGRCRSQSPSRRISRKRQVLEHLDVRLKLAAGRTLSARRRGLQALSPVLHPRRLKTHLAGKSSTLGRLQRDLLRRNDHHLASRRLELNALLHRLQSVGPQALLKRGFAMVYAAGQLVTSSKGRTPGEEIELHLADGLLVAEIKRVETREA